MKAAEKDVAAEGEVLVRAEAEDTRDPMDRSLMEWTAKTSNSDSKKSRCNKWELKETPTSPRTVKRPTRKDMVTSTSIEGM